MNTVAAVRNRILQLCGERNISINKLANICGLPPSSVKNILYGKSQNPKVLTIKMICDGLGITLSQFFDTDEFNHLEQEIRQSLKDPFGSILCRCRQENRTYNNIRSPWLGIDSQSGASLFTVDVQRLSRISSRDAPTAGTQCLFAPMGRQTKARCKEFVFCSTEDAL